MIGKTILHYRIIEKLGEGGMGVVYLAEDTTLNRQVAIKFLPPDLISDSKARDRFLREAQSASALDHPNIGTIYEINESHESPFIVMAYYQGKTLSEVISENNLSVTQAIDYAVKIAKGLQKAHNKDIIHRDIKPANIMITDEGELKIIDFGLAKLMNKTLLTQEGTTIGTVAYMSPEQAQGAKIDQRTDIWALGVILFEMLASERPFKGEYEQAVIYSILNEDHELISKLNQQVPLQLQKVLDKALQKNPEQRFQNMAGFLEMLKNLQEEKQLSLKKSKINITLSRKQKKFVVRYSIPLLIIIAIVLYIQVFREAKTPVVSIALLPLQNLTQESDQEWFTDGMTDALITDLAGISGLRIISRSSAMKYKGSNKSANEIARELGVAYIIEGSVIKVENIIKISTRLIDIMTDEYIWAKQYERSYNDILTLQGEVARAIAGQIKVKLTPFEQKELSKKQEINPEAYEAYLRGNFYWNKVTPQSLETARKYYERAAEIDSNYAPAYAGIALAYLGNAQMGYESLQNAAQKAENYIIKALQLDSTIAEVFYMKGLTNAWWKWEFDKSAAAFENAIRLNPNFSEARAYYSHVLFMQNHGEKAMQQIEIALQLDPFSALLKALYGMDLMYARRYDEVINMLEKNLLSNPGDIISITTLRSAYHQTKNYKKALQIWTKYFETRNDNEAVLALKKGINEGGYSVALQRVAELMIERSKIKYVTPWQIATLYTRAGMKNEAMEWFEKAYDAHDPNMPYLSIDPIFDDMREDPRFKNLVKKIGL